MRLDSIRGLFADEDAVSPVIGVILMVAITVILAAVIGTFVLGLGQDVTNSQAPTAQFTFDAKNTGDGTATNDIVNITHNGGDAIPKSRLTVNVAGTDASTITSGASYTDFPNSDVTAGDGAGIEESGSDKFGSGDTVRVVWTSEGGGSSQTLAEYEVP